jgi:hypothetical protein
VAVPPGQSHPEGGRHLLGACGFLAPYQHSLDPQVPLGDACLAVPDVLLGLG